jgi:hypothetical protein
LHVAHEVLFRVWDSLHDWLLEDRKALALLSQIEEAAVEFHAENQAESRKWPEERILDAVREIGRSGVSMEDVARPDLILAFLGPTDPKEILTVLGLTNTADGMTGSERYGEAWRLPLGHEARASAGVRLALLDDPRGGTGLGVDGLPDFRWAVIPGTEVVRSSFLGSLLSA